MTSAKLAVAGLWFRQDERLYVFVLFVLFTLFPSRYYFENKCNYAFVKIKKKGALGTDNRGSWSPLERGLGVSKGSQETLERVC